MGRHRCPNGAIIARRDFMSDQVVRPGHTHGHSVNTANTAQSQEHEAAFPMTLSTTRAPEHCPGFCRYRAGALPPCPLAHDTPLPKDNIAAASPRNHLLRCQTGLGDGGADITSDDIRRYVRSFISPQVNGTLQCNLSVFSIFPLESKMRDSARLGPPIGDSSKHRVAWLRK